MKKQAQIIIRTFAIQLIVLLSIGIFVHVLIPAVNAGEMPMYGYCGDMEEPSHEQAAPCCAEENHTPASNDADMGGSLSTDLAISSFDVILPKFQEATASVKLASHKYATEKTIVLRI